MNQSNINNRVVFQVCGFSDDRKTAFKNEISTKLQELFKNDKTDEIDNEIQIEKVE